MSHTSQAPAAAAGPYIEAALAVIADVGVENLSMRKVASTLGVSPMAMYKHFPNKEALLTAALDAFIARADVLPHKRLPWDQWIAHVGQAMYRALCANTSWVPLLGSLRLGAQAAAVTDAFVARLSTDGFTVEQALEAYFGVIQVVIGAVCLQASVQRDQAQRARKKHKRRTRAPDNAPTITTLSYLASADHRRLQIAPLFDQVIRNAQIDIGLPLVIDALRLRRQAGASAVTKI